jgi:hypothetical protein
MAKWTNFFSNEEVIDRTNAYFEDLPKTYFSDGLKKIEKRLTKCIEFQGDYVEKLKKKYKNKNSFNAFFSRTLTHPRI